jgi:hypothetical protein
LVFLGNVEGIDVPIVTMTTGCGKRRGAMAVARWNPTMPWRPFQQPWSPFEGIELLRNDMDRLFESFAGSTQPSSILESGWTPRVDLLEHETEFVLMADLPGMKQEESRKTCTFWCRIIR